MAPLRAIEGAFIGMIGAGDEGTPFEDMSVGEAAKHAASAG